MKLVAVVTTLSVYCGCSTWKTFWQEIFTPVSMKSYRRRNVNKQRKIKYGEKYITLDISLKYGILDKMKIKYSKQKHYLVIEYRIVMKKKSS